jgi:hypothetical protein
MDIYETRNRLSFVAAFVAISYLCFEVILDNRLIIQFSGDVGVKGQNKYYYTTTNIIVKSQVLVIQTKKKIKFNKLNKNKTKDQNKTQNEHKM